MQTVIGNHDDFFFIVVKGFRELVSSTFSEEKNLKVELECILWTGHFTLHQKEMNFIVVLSTWRGTGTKRTLWMTGWGEKNCKVWEGWYSDGLLAAVNSGSYEAERRIFGRAENLEKTWLVPTQWSHLPTVAQMRYWGYDRGFTGRIYDSQWIRIHLSQSGNKQICLNSKNVKKQQAEIPKIGEVQNPESKIVIEHGNLSVGCWLEREIYYGVLQS